MSNLKRWRTLGGGTFYRFAEVGQMLDGVWRGTQPGKFGDNGIVETPDGVQNIFKLSVGLKDLLRLKPGCEVRIKYLGKKEAKNGNQFSAYQIDIAEDAEVTDHEEGEETPF